MNRTKRKMLSLTTALILASFYVLPVAAASLESDNELIRMMSWYTYYSEGSPNITAIRPAENDMVSRYFWTEIEGVAVYCEDPSALEGAVIGDYTLTSEYTTASGFISVSSYADMVETLRASCPEATEPEAYSLSLNLPAMYAKHTDNICILRSSDEAFVELLDQQTLFTPIGVMVSDWYTYGYFYGAETPLYVVAEAEGLDTAALETATDYALTAVESGYGQTQEVLVHHFKFADMTADISLEDAIAVCDQLKSCAGVADAWIAGVYYPNREYYYTDSASIEGLSSYDLGDIDSNDIIDTADAVLALQEYVNAMMEFNALTVDESVRADVTGDGNVDSLDALLILQFYTRFTIIGEVGLTFDQLMNE